MNTDYAYDSLNRLTKRNVDLATDIETLYTYKDSALRGTGYTTTQLATEKLGGISYGYNYDNMGNITSIVKGSNAYRSYTYDDLGQLTSEHNLSSNTMTSYTYNHLGNIVQKDVAKNDGITEVGLVTYGYSADSNAGWKYLLTSITTVDYTNGGSTTTETIDYDAIGNPITYRGAAMAWKGRQLTGYTKNGVTSTFSYDADGLRSTKTVGGVKTEYQYVGDQLFYEKRGDSQEFYYFYDSYGNLSKIYYTFINTQNNTTSRAVYHALTNAQGDVIALYNGSGTLVAQYEYDAWGNTLSIKNASGATIDAWYNIAVANPIRYRGYYYDSDLGLYYLQSRYYDSGIGRFINADGTLNGNGDVLGFNMFAYCGNNPVMYSDPNGRGFFGKLAELLWTNIKTSVSYLMAPIKAITFSGSFGIGIGVEASGNICSIPLGFNVVDSDSTTVEIKGGKIRKKFTSGENMSLDIGEVYSVGGFDGYGHYFDASNCSCGGFDGTIYDRIMCPANQIITENEQTLGASVGGYLGIGFECSISLDLYAWLEEKNRIDEEYKAFRETWSWDE